MGVVYVCISMPEFFNDILSTYNYLTLVTTGGGVTFLGRHNVGLSVCGLCILWVRLLKWLWAVPRTRAAQEKLELYF